jgi:hypothetical protein
MLRLALFLCLVPAFAACGGKNASDGDEGDADTDADSDTDTDTDPSGCQALTDGKWVIGGPVLDAQAACDLQFNATNCQFQLGNCEAQGIDTGYYYYYYYESPDYPAGGLVVGDQATLAGSQFWNSCVGTVTGGTQIAGVCSQNGANFQLSTNN